MPHADGGTQAQGDHARLLRELSRAPAVAWPTLSRFVLLYSSTIASDALAILGQLPLGAALAINSVLGYLGFSVIHDSIHRSISRNGLLNDCVGQFSLLLGGPLTPLSVFRWGHIQHHRYANGPRDPDSWLHGAAWTLPLRWLVIDLRYFLYLRAAARSGERAARRLLPVALTYGALSVAIVAVAFVAGVGWEVVVVWLLAPRISSLLLGFAFFWLPHVPHDVEQERDVHRATTVRLGWDWLMTPLLQYQNYHLLHHLYPSAPFYNNGRLWRLLEPELRRHTLAIQHDFAIQPTIYAGRSDG